MNNEKHENNEEKNETADASDSVEVTETGESENSGASESDTEETAAPENEDKPKNEEKPQDIFAALFDWNLLRGPIGRWASAKYDRQIALTGDMDVKLLSWTPTVVVRGLKVGGPDWARDRDTADVDEVRASLGDRTRV